MKTTIELEEDEFGTAGKETDPLDNAARLEAQFNYQALSEFRHRNKPEHEIGEKDPETGLYPERECDDCGEPLAQHRLEAGRARCVPCQELKETKEKRNGR